MKKYINDINGEELNIEILNILPENSMLKNKPELFEIFDFNNNSEDIYKLTKGSSKFIKLKCKKCNSLYDIRVHDSIRGRSCNYCSGKKVNHSNSLENNYPKISKLWSYDKNEDKPYEITYGSEKSRYFNCDTCKNIHLSKIKDKVKSPGCPYCSGHRTNTSNSLKNYNKKLIKEWDFIKNKINPDEISPHSNKKVYWIGGCGHSFLASPKSRNKGSGCIYCKGNKDILIGFNDIKTTNKDLYLLILKEEDALNHSEFSNKFIDFKCNNCNYIIKNKKISDVNSYGLSCSNCIKKSSYPERLMKFLLDQLNIEFIHDKSTEWSNKKRYDFIINDKSLIIEMHGAQHYNGAFNKLGGRTLQQEKINDELKMNLAINNGINNYIVIDSRRSNLKHIKKSIMNSKLKELLDLNKIKWDELYKKLIN